MFKKIRVLLFSLLLHPLFSDAQTVFSLSSVNDTLPETAGFVMLAKIATNTPSLKDDTFDVVFKPATLSAADINSYTIQTVIVPAGVDSFPFYVQITNDIDVEFPETGSFVLRKNGQHTTLSPDSAVALTVLDNELSATIGFIRTVDSISEIATYYLIKVVSNNPNPTAVRAFVRGDNYSSSLQAAGIEWGFINQFYNFQSGLDTQDVYIYLYDDIIQEPTDNVMIKISDFGANNVVDSSFNLFVLDDDAPLPVYISFTSPPDSVWEDTAGTKPVFVEIYNPHNRTYRVQIVQDNIHSTAGPKDYYFFNPTFMAYPGYNYDTVFIDVKDDEVVEGLEKVILTTKFDGGNLSSDSTYTFYIIDKDTVKIGFLGAGFSYLEDVGRSVVKLVTTSPMPFDISVPVTYFNGNATPNVDFVYHDTLIVFPANSTDTQMVYIDVIEDNIKEINEQVNIRLGTPTPHDTKIKVLQFSFFIIDNDTFALSVDDILQTAINLSPNPFKSIVKLVSEVEILGYLVSNMSGEYVMRNNDLEQDKEVLIDASNLSSGMYFIEVITAERSIRKKIIKE